jgi:deazaflavin-dependent oxidoreductase (nitroreductase family)
MTTRRSPRFYRLVGLIGTSRLITRLHPPVYRLTGGRWIVGSNLGVRNVILTTIGRTSGRAREVPLFAFEDEGSLVVIGSYAGRDRDPAWVGNLVANPDATIRVGRDVRPVRARVVEGGERERLWALAVRAYPGYADYATWTRRRIPVIALDPADA